MSKTRIVEYVLAGILISTQCYLPHTMPFPKTKIKREDFKQRNIYGYKKMMEVVNKQIEENILKEKERIAEEERIKQEELERQKELEEIEKYRIHCTFEVSFYTTSVDECGNNLGIGASGEEVIPWVSIALPNNIPFYSKATIEGLGTFINHDTGSYIQWTDDNICRVDILVNNKQEAINLGRFTADGYIDLKKEGE